MRLRHRSIARNARSPARPIDCNRGRATSAHRPFCRAIDAWDGRREPSGPSFANELPQTLFGGHRRLSPEASAGDAGAGARWLSVARRLRRRRAWLIRSSVARHRRERSAVRKAPPRAQIAIDAAGALALAFGIAPSRPIERRRTIAIADAFARRLAADIRSRHERDDTDQKSPCPHEPSLATSRAMVSKTLRVRAGKLGHYPALRPTSASRSETRQLFPARLQALRQPRGQQRAGCAGPRP